MAAGLPARNWDKMTDAEKAEAHKQAEKSRMFLEMVKAGLYDPPPPPDPSRVPPAALGTLSGAFAAKMPHDIDKPIWWKFWQRLKLKGKRKPTHFKVVPRIGGKYNGFHLCTLPDGRRGKLWARGWLDANGEFYEMPEGGIGKVQDIHNLRDEYGVYQEIKYLYVPIDALKINSFGIGIIWK